MSGQSGPGRAEGGGPVIKRIVLLEDVGDRNGSFASRERVVPPLRLGLPHTGREAQCAQAERGFPRVPWTWKAGALVQGLRIFTALPLVLSFHSPSQKNLWVPLAARQSS